MTRVIFFESAAYPHCASQKARLTAMGHDVESFDLINEPWSVSSLRPFFGSKPVHEWFDPLASRIVSGEIDPGCITPQSALVQMILDPTLINGPLIRIGNHCEAGMNADADLGMFRMPRADRSDGACASHDVARRSFSRTQPVGGKPSSVDYE